MAETAFDEKYLFSNFDSETGTEPEEEQSSNVKTKKKKTKKTATTTDDDTEQEVNAQNKYINELELQNTKLKAIVKRMMGPQSFSMSNLNDTASGEFDLVQKLEEDIQSNPFAIVLFPNNDVSTASRREIDELMKEISKKESKQEVLMAQKMQPQNSAVPLKAFCANAKGRRFNLGKTKDSDEPYIVCACQYYKSFYIDRLGAPLLESNPNVTDIWDIPAYQQVFFKALPILEEALNVRIKQLKTCFNCGGEHHLNECPEPKDQQRIRENRQNFTKNFSSPVNYKFQIEETDERFKHFKPGVISVTLEEALGISLKEQLPPYIYKMREMGYPPGWVKPAEDDGLKMYGADGNVVESIDYEEGEIKNIVLPDVIKYAGYNAPIPSGVQDEYRTMNLPPYNKERADYDIIRKRAKILGYFENEPLAKHLKFGAENESMDIDNEETVTPGSKPPLPLIDVTARPPSPSVELSDDEPKKKDQITENAESNEKLENEEVFHEGKDEKDESNEPKTPKNKGTKPDGSQSLPRHPSAKDIDETTYRHWYGQPFTSVGLSYVMYTPPPMCNVDVLLDELPRNPVTDIDREPWKTSSVSWYFPLYGDLAAPTGTFDSIRTLFKETKRPKRKPML